MNKKLFEIVYDNEPCHKTVEGPYQKETIYNQYGDMVKCEWVEIPEHLDNTNMPQTNPEFLPVETGDDNMAKIRRNVTINGLTHSIRASSEQEYVEKVLALSGKQDNTPTSAPLFRDYAERWFTCHQASLEEATRVSYRSQLDRYLLPALGIPPWTKSRLWTFRQCSTGLTEQPRRKTKSRWYSTRF